MPRRVSTAEAVAAVAALPAGRTLFVGVDGPGGAGKTTLAGRLVAGAPAATLVHVDDFCGPRTAEWDWARLREQLLLPLLAGKTARYQCWNWGLDAGGQWVDVEPGHVVVIEGVSATRREVGAPWALTIWVDTPGEVRRARALERDGLERWPVWEQQWIPLEEAYIAREQPHRRVELIVDGTDPG